MDPFWIVMVLISCVLVSLGGWHVVTEVVGARRRTREMSELSAKLAQLR